MPIITAKETFSPGDAMRDIYTHGIITSDFVLVFGDLVSNVRIDEVVKVHKERRKTNKDMIMTMVVKEGGVRHRTKYVVFFEFFSSWDPLCFFVFSVLGVVESDVMAGLIQVERRLGGLRAGC